MQYGAQGAGDQVTAATAMQAYPHGVPPAAMILTEFHALLLTQAAVVCDAMPQPWTRHLQLGVMLAFGVSKSGR
jgi:hypothetical protein